MSNLLLGVRTSLYDFKRIKLENVDFDSKIENFKLEVSKIANIHKDSLELVYCGNILNDDSTLRGNGIKPGVMVHVLKKKAKEVPHPTQQLSEADVFTLVAAFRTLTLTPSYRTSLQKLSRPDILDNIIMFIPGLSRDPVAISIIQDPELLVRLGDIETVRRILQLHPALIEAANHIAAAAHEEAVSSNNCGGPSTSAGFSQLMDVLSDEDDMESSQSSDSVQQGVSRQQSFSAITPAQLAAALASASQGTSGTSTSSTISGNAANNAGGAGSNETSSAITPEMVNEAMQRAMATVAPTSRLAGNTEGSSQGGNSDFTEQMRQMRELGLTDEVINLQALQLAGGNVHAAIDLVFSGAISSEQQ